MVRCEESRRLQLSPAMERLLIEIFGHRFVKFETIDGRFMVLGTRNYVTPSSATVFALIDRGLLRRPALEGYPVTPYTLTKKGRKAILAIRAFQRGQ